MSVDTQKIEAEIYEIVKDNNAHTAIKKLTAKFESAIKEARKDTEKAYGGCHNCYGKGYATKQSFVSGGGKKWQTSPISYCTCDRGKQLASLTNSEPPKLTSLKDVTTEHLEWAAGRASEAQKAMVDEADGN